MDSSVRALEQLRAWKFEFYTDVSCMSVNSGRVTSPPTFCRLTFNVLTTRLSTAAAAAADKVHFELKTSTQLIVGVVVVRYGS